MRRKTVDCYQRRAPQRRYKRLYLIVCEGSKTEPEYFRWLNSVYDGALIHIEVKKRNPNESAPKHVLKTLRQIEHKRFQGDDELWAVVDIDEWPIEQLKALEEWQKEHKRNQLACSNPKFEYWVILHQQDPGHCSDTRCKELFQNMMGSQKGINTKKLSLHGLKSAVRCAKAKQNCDSNQRRPSTCGSSLFLLIENIEEFLACLPT